MPLQNRVAPDGSLHAVPDRGTMMGNRGGKFHRDDKTVGNRRWASHHWICCELHYKNMHHEPMGQGYTSVFFLDEVTALAAGHRPCFFCRRREAKAFLSAADTPVRAGVPLNVDILDRQLHAERRRTAITPAIARGTQVPDAAMLTDGTSFFAFRNNHLLRWSFGGYTERMPFNPSMPLNLLTPPSILAILHNGYSPRWHSSAFQWDNDT